MPNSIVHFCDIRAVSERLFRWSGLAGFLLIPGFFRTSLEKPEGAGAALRQDGVNELAATEPMQAGVVGEPSVEPQGGTRCRKTVAPCFTAIEAEEDFTIR